MKLSRLYELLEQYDAEYNRAGSSHAKEYVLGKKKAIGGLIQEVLMENEISKELRKERKERKQRLGI